MPGRFSTGLRNLYPRTRMKTDTPRPILLKDYRPPNYLIDHVDLDVSLHRSAPGCSARLKVRPNPAFDGDPGALRLDGEMIELESVRLDGRQLGAWRHTSSPTRSSSSASRPPAPFTLETVTYCNPEANKALTGLYLLARHLLHAVRGPGLPPHHLFPRSPRRAGHLYHAHRGGPRRGPGAAVQRQSRRARHARRGQAALCGVARSASQALLPVRPRRRQPGLLASDFTPPRAARSTCKIYVEPGKEGRCAWAMDALKRSMRWDEERFGREYDLDVFNIVAVSDFNMGAMENKGLNIFNDALVLASPETATDQSFADIERVIAHEYFHNWTGNRITCRDWFQLCLKEGLTVFRDQEFCADQRSATVQRIRDVRNLKARQFPGGRRTAGPSGAPRPLHRDQQLLYGDRLREGRRARAHDPDPARARGIPQRAWISTSSATTARRPRWRNSSPASRTAPARTCAQFMTWYAQAGTPELVCKLKYDRARQDGGADHYAGAAADAGRGKKEAAAHPAAAGAHRAATARTSI